MDGLIITYFIEKKGIYATTAEQVAASRSKWTYDDNL